MLNCRCIEAYNALAAYNLFREINRYPRLKLALDNLTKDDWKKLKKEHHEQWLDMQIYA